MYILFCVSFVCIHDGRVVAMRDRNDGLYIMFMLFLGWPVDLILCRMNKIQYNQSPFAHFFLSLCVS